LIAKWAEGNTLFAQPKKKGGDIVMLFLPREEGQGLVEYALILVLVAIVVIAILLLLGPVIGNVFSNIVTNL
jgi:pilus assembly protein Flp/PilA